MCGLEWDSAGVARSRGWVGTGGGKDLEITWERSTEASDPAEVANHSGRERTGRGACRWGAAGGRGCWRGARSWAAAEKGKA